jgi:phosphatidylethanolamine-binding protein (PEBP) family uncharacterized protein
MRRGRDVLRSGVPLLALICLAGCSNVGSQTANTTPVVPIKFSSPAVRNSVLPSRYTCDGANITPPLSWGAVPAGTKEMVLLVLGLHTSASGHNSITVEGAMAGINPAAHKLGPGEEPAGAFLEQTTARARRYSVCPPKGTTVQYEFAIFAVPPTVTMTPSVSGIELFQALALPNSRFRAPASGQFPAIYKRA